MKNILKGFKLFKSRKVFVAPPIGGPAFAGRTEKKEGDKEFTATGVITYGPDGPIEFNPYK